MPTQKTISVVLQDAAASELKGVLGPWLRNNELVAAYVNCMAVDPNGPYFFMKLKVPGTNQEIEAQIPHAYVKGILASADLRKLGFA